MASRAGSRLISNSYAHQADRSAAPSNVQQQHQQSQQSTTRRQHRYLHGSMARRAPAGASNLSFTSHAAASSSSSSSAAAAGGSSTAAHASGAGLARPSSSAAAAGAAEDSAGESDIIIRDERGEYRLEMPSVTPLPRDEARDEREMESRLIESFRKHHQQIEPAELKRTLQASLAAKAASLDRDAWMFEGDDVVPVESP